MQNGFSFCRFYEKIRFFLLEKFSIIMPSLSLLQDNKDKIVLKLDHLSA